MLEELIGQNSIGRNLAHHDETQAFFTTLETELRHHVDHTLSLFDSAYKWHHDLNVIQTHIFTNTLHRSAL
jgi:hypothetical protein